MAFSKTVLVAVALMAAHCSMSAVTDALGVDDDDGSGSNSGSNSGSGSGSGSASPSPPATTVPATTVTATTANATDAPNTVNTTAKAGDSFGNINQVNTTTAKATDAPVTTVAATTAKATDAPVTTVAATAEAGGANGLANTTTAAGTEQQTRQILTLAISMSANECETVVKNADETKANIQSVVKAANISLDKVDLDSSSAKCDTAGRQRRAQASTTLPDTAKIVVTIVFQESVSADDAAKITVATNTLISAGLLKVTLTIGGVQRTIEITQMATQGTAVVTVVSATTTVTTAVVTTAVVNTPKASASLARGSTLLVAALAVSHALLA